jgi:hypothetical protein
MPEPAGPRAALARLRVALAGIWAGGLLTIAAVAAPAAFAALPTASAGAVVRRVFAVEAAASLVLGVLLMLLERRLRRDAPEPAPTMTAEVLLPAGAVFCTVAGYYALLPLLDQARAGAGPLSFGALHAVSTLFFAVKLLLVSALLWRSSR